MRVIIHDLSEEKFLALCRTHPEDKIFSESNKIRDCIGCFGCWLKTPGECVIRDGYESMGEILSRADEVIIISKCCYGCYSPFVKNILDRSISYLLPFFTIKKREVHHAMRYDNRFALKVFFYGDISREEMKTAKRMIKANSFNFNYSDYEVFFNDFDSLTHEKIHENRID